MMVPTVHLNGTMGAELLDNVSEICGALREALEAMRAGWPNGRDYYPQGPEAFKKACSEWDARLVLVEGVRKEFQELAEKIVDAMEERDGDVR